MAQVFNQTKKRLIFLKIGQHYQTIQLLYKDTAI